jgi:hypothetical protein
MNDIEAASWNGTSSMTTLAGDFSLSPASTWLYNELSKDHIAANSNNELALQREHIFDSLWDLHGNVDLFVAANKVSEETIFPVNFLSLPIRFLCC